MAMPGFEELLASLLSQEASVRQHGETALNELLTQQPEPVATNFIAQMEHSPAPELRDLAAVLFRRYCLHPTLGFWDRCSPPVQEQIKQALLSLLITDQTDGTRSKIVYCIGQLATKFLVSSLQAAHDNPRAPKPGHWWPELLQCLWHCAQSGQPKLREVALQIIHNVPAVFGSEQNRYFDEIKSLIFNSLADVENSDVQTAACRAFVSFAMILRQDSKAKSLGDLIPACLEAIRLFVSADKAEDATFCLEQLIELAEARPKVLKPHLNSIVQHCCMFGHSQETDEGVRSLSLELLVTMAEALPGAVRKNDTYLQNVIPLALSFMCEIQDEEGWSQQDRIEDGDDFETVAVGGERSLDRLSLSLGGRILNVAFTSIPEMVGSEVWQNRHAALMAISVIAEGCVKELRPELPRVLQLVLPRVQDPHPRVRYAACNALGQLATDFAAQSDRHESLGFQAQHHAVVMPALLGCLEDVENPRVQAHGAAALVNFCDAASKELLEPYLDQMLTRLGGMLSSPFVIVQEQAVSTIATVADSAADKFIGYYDAFMPPLKSILSHSIDPKHRLLRGKTMECISLIGMAVGKEKFLPDATSVMELLAAAQEQQTDDDPTTSYIQSAWARVCQILEADFAPYLPFVMPPLLAAVTAKPIQHVLEDDDSEDDLPDGPEHWTVVWLADSDGNAQRVAYQVSSLEDKRFACEMLCVYARVMQAHFAPYLTQVFGLLHDHLAYQFEEGARRAAAIAQPYLVSAGIAAGFGLDDINSMWTQMCTGLLDAMKMEDELDVIAFQFDAIKETIRILGRHNLQQILSSEALKHICDYLKEYIETYEERCTMRNQERKKDEDYDPSAGYDEEENLENDVLKELVGIIHEGFAAMNEQFMPFVHDLLPLFSKFLDDNRAFWDRQWALCVFDDVIEFCGPKSFELSGLFLHQMIHYISDEHAEVRQAAAYGVGAMSLHGGDQYTSASLAALDLLVAVINQPDSRSLDNCDATENCISAVVKIVRMPHNGVPASQAVPLILQWLPVTMDDEEADYTYGYFLELINEHNPVMLQSDNLFVFTRAMLSVIHKDVISHKLRMSMLQTFESYKDQVPGLSDAIDPQLQANLAAAVALAAHPPPESQ